PRRAMAQRARPGLQPAHARRRDRAHVDRGEADVRRRCDVGRSLRPERRPDGNVLRCAQARRAGTRGVARDRAWPAAPRRRDRVSAMEAIEIKAFVPAKAPAVSRRFYADLGFTMKSDHDGVAYFACGSCAFLLQDYYVKEFAENCAMHLLVPDVHAWHEHVK